MPQTDSSARIGVIAGIGAFAWWGFMPVYWKQLDGLPPLELVAHRVVWALIFVLLVQTWRGGFGRMRAALFDRRERRIYVTGGLLIGTNWLIFVTAVLSNRIVEVSLGYFLAPLCNVLLGRMVLGERLSLLQGISVVLAACGVGIQIAAFGHIPWAALGVATTFSVYGLVRKHSACGPLTSLSLETLTLLPIAGAYVVWLAAQGDSLLGTAGMTTYAWIAGTGVITSIPLLLFAHAARRVRLSTLGLLQYIGPTASLLIGVLLYTEPFGPERAAAFSLIWIALALYSFESLRLHNRPVPANPAT